MLRNALHDMRPIGQKVLVTLLGRIPDKGNKLIDVMHLPGGRYAQDHLQEIGLPTQLIY